MGDSGKNHFVDLGYFDESSINLTASPLNPNDYLKQVIVGRRACPDVVRAEIKTEFTPLFRQIVPEIIDEKEAEVSWQLSKSTDFAEKRNWLLGHPPSKKVTYKWPSLNADKWEEILLEKAPLEFSDLMVHFPNHVGIPPALSVVQSLSPTQVNNLIPLLVDCAETTGLSRPIREWLFALLLVVGLPLLHDVVSAIRNLAKIAKTTRSTVPNNRKEDISELSWFIAIIGHYFNQKDLCDRSDIRFVK